MFFLRTVLLLFLTFCIPFEIVSASSGTKQDSLIVLDPNPSRSLTDEMMRQHLRLLSHKALDNRLEKYEGLKAKQQIDAYQQEMRRFFFSQLDLPERTPLNARIVDKEEFIDYRREKILYESQPGLYVPAILYLPQTAPPYPGVLILCGHDDIGKAAYQEIGISLAQNGIASLCPDPIGQGERKQILDKNGQPMYGPTTEHLIAGVAPILLGRSLATYMIWDGIRAIDYLISRPEIDPSRIGCTGNSGGGNRTSYLMALDDRIQCAAPGCFITTTRRKNESPGPGDAEQNIHAQIDFGMDHSDYIIMGAPKPILILSATRDFVPIEGTWESFRQAKRIYTRMGFPERVDLVEVDGPHGFSAPLRLSAVRWMRRWLLNMDDAVTEKEMNTDSLAGMKCTANGQVLLMSGARSVFDLNIEREQQLTDQRKGYWQKTDTETILKKIREITDIRKFNDLPQANLKEVAQINRKGYVIKKIILEWDTKIRLPSLLFQSDLTSGEYYLYLHDQGKNKDSGIAGAIEKLVKEGNVILVVDLRGIGETATTPWRYKKAIEFTGRDVAEYFIAYMLDKSFVGMRTEDVLISARYLHDLIPINEVKQIHMIAWGKAGPPALHAMALEPGLFESLTLRQSLVSWSDVVETPVTRGALINTVHGALKFYDLPDLVKIIGEKRIKVQEPVNAQNKIMK
jgi:dienelactone hydrolase